ncbi:hypothetical protein TNCV_3952371 [Trichonephila clavipes]|uniref:Transposase n=1 Tax=Trichonephila clavipes TaxID=2585209 RepID=A0A8X6S556_TRICX|nr:hypothetical protein TNCV_3952341 [Trichonephila clavipes]GFY04830.1 hypothetical protein TNCV_3952371 [Trichonephila clavipes]
MTPGMGPQWTLEPCHQRLVQRSSGDKLLGSDLQQELRLKAKNSFRSRNEPSRLKFFTHHVKDFRSYEKILGMPVIENVDKTTKLIEVDRHVSNRSIAQELKIEHRTVSNHLHKTGFKGKLDMFGCHTN